jgi:lysine-N-methylase
MMGLKSNQHESWAVYLEQLMVYFVFTYFCGAVYDDNILGKMQTAVVSTILIQELAMARWIEQGKSLGFHDVVDIAHKVSREIEHSDVNLVRLEKICEKMPMFSTEELLRVVLSVILLEG